MKVKLPIGIENFSEIRTGQYYYADKTGLIKQLLDTSYKVNLITRPRRFGKTLAVTMLADFFDIRKNNKEIFDGLLISQTNTLYNANLNQWPVLFLSFKDIDGLNFASACKYLEMLIFDLCVEHEYLLCSEQVSQFDKILFEKMANRQAGVEELSNSLFLLTRMLYQHYGKQVVLLIDEYDVPLSKANDHEYYQEMLSVIRTMFSKALKTNPYLKWAVLTGCLRISKESIFTGVNNFAVDTVLDNRYCEYFGFEDKEVQELLHQCELSNYYMQTKQWYDGYHFGDIDVYCPWDVINYCSDLLINPTAAPKDYWRNTSGNSIIKLLLQHSTQQIRSELEKLLNGETLEKQILNGITYDMLNPANHNSFSVDSIWTALLLTGYLTGKNIKGRNMVSLSIPNHQIRILFEDLIMEWLKEKVSVTVRDSLITSFWMENTSEIERILNGLLVSTISIFDYKEDFYHGYLTGILKSSGFIIKTNAEYGLGRLDILVEDTENQRVLIIETKHSRSEKSMEHDCMAALQQIVEKKYAQAFEQGFKSVVIYGISFFRKQCKVRMKKLL